MARPTIADLARAADVSTATVDRVLNGRSNVREETVRRVHKAAEDIGYHAANVIRHRMLADRSELRLGLVLQKFKHRFYQDVLAIFEQQARANTRPASRSCRALLKRRSPGNWPRCCWR